MEVAHWLFPLSGPVHTGQGASCGLGLQFGALLDPLFGATMSPSIWFLVQIGGIILIFYLLLIRPQARRQKEHQKMLEALQKGDRILTTGGLYASVLNVKDNVVVANIADNVKVEISRSAVAARVDKGTK